MVLSIGPVSILTCNREGAVDELLAQREAARARKRELEAEESTPRNLSPKRRRSYSSDSVSTISTQSPSPVRHPEREQSQLGAGSRSRSRSRNSRDLPSAHSPPPRDNYRPPYSEGRSESLERSGPSTAPQTRRGPSPHQSPRAVPIKRGNSRTKSRSRSPPRRSPAGIVDQKEYRSIDSWQHGERRALQRSPARSQQPQLRERSLSPFSKRLAMTQAMNMGR